MEDGVYLVPNKTANTKKYMSPKEYFDFCLKIRVAIPESVVAVAEQKFWEFAKSEAASRSNLLYAVATSGHYSIEIAINGISLI